MINGMWSVIKFGLSYFFVFVHEIEVVQIMLIGRKIVLRHYKCS